MVRHLRVLQNYQTTAVAPNADLVVWSRLGSSYSPSDLVSALEDRSLIEVRGMIRPSEDVALFRAEMAEWPGNGELLDWQEFRSDWVKANDACRLDILDRLADFGPLTSRELPDMCDVPWESTGWTNNQNVIKLLDFMVQRGEVATAGRRGRERLWDLAAHVYPDVPVVPKDEALRIRKRTAAALARHRPCQRTRVPDGAARRGRGRRAGRGRGRQGYVASRPNPFGSKVFGPGGVVVSTRPADLRPRAHGRLLRVRLPAGDVQARRQAPVGVFRASDPLRRPASGQARRHRRPQSRSLPGRCHSPGRGLQQDDDGRSGP
jgi:hypothetical protein